MISLIIALMVVLFHPTEVHISFHAHFLQSRACFQPLIQQSDPVRIFEVMTKHFHLGNILPAERVYVNVNHDA